MSSTPIEITIRVSNEEKKESRRYVRYEPFTMSPSDPSIKEIIDKAVKEFEEPIDDLVVTAKMVLK